MMAVLTPLSAGGKKVSAAIHIVQNKKTGFGKPSAQHAHAVGSGEFPKVEKDEKDDGSASGAVRSGSLQWPDSPTASAPAAVTPKASTTLADPYAVRSTKQPAPE